MGRWDLLSGSYWENQIFHFFLKKSTRSNLYKLFLRQYFLCKSTISSNFYFLHFCLRRLLFFKVDQRKRSSWNGRWSPLRQKSIKQKLLKMVDLLNKNCLGNNLWKLDHAGFWRKKIDFLIKIPTKDFIFWFSVMVLPLLCNHTSLDTVSSQISWICSSTLWLFYWWTILLLPMQWEGNNFLFLPSYWSK